LFYDSFENGTWNGLWSEDSQNDWFVSTQRATSGSRSAEVDGRASDAQLVSVPIDLQGNTEITVSFNWYIENRIDNGEYLAFDVSTDGGSTWTEKALLQGNVDAENTWHSVQVDLNGIFSLQLRFRGKMSGSGEDANVDEVKVTGASGGELQPNLAPVASFSHLCTDLYCNFSDISTDSDGNVDSWSWNFGDDSSSTDQSPSHTYATEGTYTINLTVTDDDGATNSTNQDVTVTAANALPIPGFSVSISGLTASFTDTSTDSDGTIASWSWDFGEGSNSTEQNPSHTYSVSGSYIVKLSVTDNDGGTDSVEISVTVEDSSVVPIEVFSDSFENGTWNGLWSEDSQNDWFVSTQRATSGSRSAEVDGRASDAQLVSVPIDLQGRSNASITFNWYIERRVDSNEYLAFDVSTNGGSNWTEKALLQGNVDTENTWHSVQVDLNDISGLRIRFRGRMSRGNEDANVDEVVVTVQ